MRPSCMISWTDPKRTFSTAALTSSIGNLLLGWAGSGEVSVLSAIRIPLSNDEVKPGYCLRGKR